MPGVRRSVPAIQAIVPGDDHVRVLQDDDAGSGSGPHPSRPSGTASSARTSPYYDRLDEADRRELQGHIQVFLAEKHFEGCGGLALTDEIKVTIAAQACLLLLHRETDYYRRLVTILVYPSAYTAKGGRAAGRRVSSWRARRPASAKRGRAGWSSSPGTTCGRGPRTSTTGTTSSCTSSPTSSTRRTGPPTGHRSSTAAASTSPGLGCSGAEYEQLRRASRAGKESVLDEYGATNPAEFFAVATECFFEKPAQLRRKHPELYEELKEYYRQDPERAVTGGGGASSAGTV